MSNIESLGYILPEIVLTLAIIVLFFASFFSPSSEKLFSRLALAGVFFSILAILLVALTGPRHLFFGMVAFDPFGLFIKVVCGVSALLAIIFSERSRDLEGTDLASFYILLLVLTLGLYFLVMASDLLMIYLALEMVSVISYILTGYIGRGRSSEAALKYVIYGGVASGVMIYGFSLLYGITGTLHITEIAEFLRFNEVNRHVLLLSLVLSLVGFGFKIAAFPFHMWSPDVYEGAPVSFTAFLTVGPKAAGLAVLIRFLLSSFFIPRGEGFWDIESLDIAGIVAVASICTMTIGNLAAIGQTNIKRLLAYSTIAHAGYMLMGLSAMSAGAISAILFYLAVYLVMNLGAFLVVVIIVNQFGVEDIEGYRGLGKRGTPGAVLALAMTIFLFSLVGLPPTAGFVGKFYLFGAVINARLYLVALVGALNVVVSLYYYVRIVKVMFFDEAKDGTEVSRPPFGHSAALAILAFLTLFLGIFWQGLASLVSASSKLLH